MHFSDLSVPTHRRDYRQGGEDQWEAAHAKSICVVTQYPSFAPSDAPVERFREWANGYVVQANGGGPFERIVVPPPFDGCPSRVITGSFASLAGGHERRALLQSRRAADAAWTLRQLLQLSLSLSLRLVDWIVNPLLATMTSARRGRGPNTRFPLGLPKGTDRNPPIPAGHARAAA